MSKLPLLLALFCIVFCSACSTSMDCLTPPQLLSLRFVDKDGNDLLRPANPNAFKIGEIRLYDLKDGKKTYSDVKLDSLPDGGYYFLKTDLSWKAHNGAEFFLQLSNTVTDKIYLRYDEVSNDGCTSYKFVEFRYDDKLYEPTEVPPYFKEFKIVK